MKEKQKVIGSDIRFRKLIENSYSGITLLDRDLNIIYRSPSAERINGWQEVDRVKVTMAELLHPADRAVTLQVLEDVLNNPGMSKTCTYRTKHFEGHYIWLQCTYTNMLNEPDVEAIVCNFIDVTERKLSEERVAESERFITAITDNVPALIAYWTADLKCLFANKLHLDWFNKQAGEMKGIGKEELLGKDEFKLHKQQIQNVLKGIPQSFERNFYKTDGTSIYTHTKYIPDWDGDKVKGFYSLISDITDVKRAEQELDKKTAQISDLLENMTDGFLSLDENMCYTYANKHIGKMIGMTPESLIGKNIWELFPHAVGSATYDAIKTAFKEHRYVCKQDHYEPLGLWQENRVYPSGGGVSMFIRDITKQKKEEQHLRLLESVITNTTDAILITEAQINKPGPCIVYANDAFLKMTGYTADELIGKTPRILQGPKSDMAELKRLSDCIRRYEHCEITTINYKKDGSEFWINFSVSPVFDSREVCTHFIAVERDISHQKNEEQQRALLTQAITTSLREKNDILESIGDVFFALDSNWHITYWNNVAEKVLQKTSNEVLGKDFREIYAYAADYLPLTKYAEAIATNDAVHFEHYSTFLNTWFAISAYPNPGGLSVYMKVVSDRKNAEALAKAVLEEKIDILESIGDAFFAVDKNWTVTYWNKTAETALQTPKSKIINKILWDVFADSVGSLSYKKYHEAIQTNTAAHFEDHYEALKTWYEISAYPSAKGLSVYFKDITERKLSETRLFQLNKKLEKHAKELAISNAELEQFAYVASHDLQEPLRMVTGFLTQIERKYATILDDKGRQYINFAVDGAKRMRQIILDLLEFSRIGRTDENIEAVNLDNIVTDILSLYRKQIEEKGAQIIFNGLPTINTYKAPIRQVFQNLIGNGIKYHPPGKPPIVTINCIETQKYYSFSIHDNGIGIEKEYFETIFVIFQRLHNKEEYSGTGMGLAVTKKIVENFGGKIWVESEPGKGSTFYFTILKR